MKKGAEYLHEIAHRVDKIKAIHKRLLNDVDRRKDYHYEQLRIEAGGLYHVMRKLKRQKLVKF